MRFLKKLFGGESRAETLAPVRRAPEDPSLTRFQSEMDRLFERFWQDFDRGPGSLLADVGWPALDMAEEDDAIMVRMDLPGLRAEDLDIEISGNRLTVRGERADEWSDTVQGIHRRERRSGRFERSVELPAHADREKIEAKFKEGILTLRIPKQPGKGSRRIVVRG